MRAIRRLAIPLLAALGVGTGGYFALSSARFAGAGRPETHEQHAAGVADHFRAGESRATIPAAPASSHREEDDEFPPPAHGSEISVPGRPATTGGVGVWVAPASRPNGRRYREWPVDRRPFSHYGHNASENTPVYETPEEMAYEVDLPATGYRWLRPPAAEYLQPISGVRPERGGWEVAPEIPGLTYVGRNEQGYHEYDRALGKGVALRLVLLPGGLWERGIDGDGITAWRTANEWPRHHVFLDPFLIGKYEVTQEQWQAVMGETQMALYRRVAGESSWAWMEKRREFAHPAVGPDYPVFAATYFASLQFVKRAGLNLPTEAQWEFACRGGVEFDTPNGPLLVIDDPGPLQDTSPTLEPIAWYRGNADVEYRPGVPTFKDVPIVETTTRGNPPDIHGVANVLKKIASGETAEVRRLGTHPVGLKAPNNFGLHDMLGNISETCRDYGVESTEPYRVIERLYRFQRTHDFALGNGWLIPLRNPVLCGVLDRHSDRSNNLSPETESRIQYNVRGGSFMDVRACRSGRTWQGFVSGRVWNQAPEYRYDLGFVGLRAAFELPRPEGVEGDWTVK
ncbi:MAG: formylglycine-generating enzyme family protein [Planctomycetes bacterium]|nr:formylglycine-generating enzyme family protein [Planctomycetota bacterium]